MNYIELIRSFWTSHNANSFSTTEIALYFYLLEVFNICQWKDQIKRNNRRIEADLDISYNTLKNARNKLQQTGLVYFKTKNKNANVSYSLSKFDEDTTEVTNRVTTEDGSELVSPKDKLNYTKEFNIEGKPIFISNEFLEVLEQMQIDSVWFEPICMNLKISISDYHNQLLYFFSLRTNEGADAYLSLKEAKYHFANWLRIEIAKVKPKPINQKGGRNVADYTEAI